MQACIGYTGKDNLDKCARERARGQGGDNCGQTWNAIGVGIILGRRKGYKKLFTFASIHHHELVVGINVGQLSLSPDLALRGQAGDLSSPGKAAAPTTSSDEDESSADDTKGGSVAMVRLGGLKDELLLLTGRLRLSSRDRGDDKSMLPLQVLARVGVRGERGAACCCDDDDG